MIILMRFMIWPGLEYSPALDHSEDQYDDRDDEQNMDQAAHCVCGDHAEHPEYECDNDNSYEHKMFCWKS